MPLIDPGQPAPLFSLRDQHGKRHALRDYAGRIVVLYFYPEDDTSGCTDEACQFRDALPDFGDLNAVVLGVSPDTEESHQRFADKHGLNFTLLADLPNADGEPPVCVKYGVWEEKMMYARKYMGVSRTTYLIDKEGVVAKRWDAVKVPGHAEEVFAAVSELATAASRGRAKEPVAIEIKPRKAGKTGKAVSAKSGKSLSAKSTAKPAAKKAAASTGKVVKKAAAVGVKKAKAKKQTLVGAGAKAGSGGRAATTTRAKAKKATGKARR